MGIIDKVLASLLIAALVVCGITETEHRFDKAKLATQAVELAQAKTDLLAAKAAQHSYTVAQEVHLTITQQIVQEDNHVRQALKQAAVQAPAWSAAGVPDAVIDSLQDPAPAGSAQHP